MSWFGNTHLPLCIWVPYCSLVNTPSAFYMSLVIFDNEPHNAKNTTINELGSSDLTRQYDAWCNMYDKVQASCNWTFSPLVSFLLPFKLADVFPSSYHLLLMCDLHCCNEVSVSCKCLLTTANYQMAGNDLAYRSYRALARGYNWVLCIRMIMALQCQWNQLAKIYCNNKKKTFTEYSMLCYWKCAPKLRKFKP